MLSTAALPQAIAATSTGLIITGEISFEEWSAIGSQFGRGMESVAWCIGDWLVFGESQFAKRVTSEAYDAAVAATGMDRQTLKDYATVCRAIAPDKRTEKMSFAHHRALVPLAPEKREAWVKVVSETTIRPSTRRLRASIRAAAATEKPHILTDDEILNRDSGPGHDNYGVHLIRLKTVLRKDFPNMDAQQKGVVKEEIAELLAIVGM